MRSVRWSIIFLVALAPLFLPSEAAAIGCWLCQNQLDTCRYYRQSDYAWCIDGCSRNPYPGCSADCYTIYQNGLAACQADFQWCVDGCTGEIDRPRQNCPIVLDLGRHNWNFTAAEGGVLFDIDGDGHRDAIAWTDPEAGDGFLAWDRNLNGVIDSGRELFGDSTTQPPSNEPNGFFALAVLDQVDNGGNGDGMISNQDRLWNALQVWVDRNHNGQSEPNELAPLGVYRIEAIDLAFHESKRKDRYGNQLRYRTEVRLEDGPAIKAVDVFFLGLP